MAWLLNLTLLGTPALGTVKMLANNHVMRRALLEQGGTHAARVKQAQAPARLGGALVAADGRQSARCIAMMTSRLHVI